MDRSHCFDERWVLAEILKWHSDAYKYDQRYAFQQGDDTQPSDFGSEKFQHDLKMTCNTAG